MNQKHSTLRHRQAGFTLIETIIVIALAGLALAGIFGMVQSARQSTNVANETLNVQGLAAGVRSLYPSGQVYTGLSASMMIQANKAPIPMVNANSTGLVSAWSQPVTVAAQTNGGFDITYGPVPAPSCIEFALAAGSAFNMVTVGTTVVKSPTVALNAANVTMTCASPTQTITFNTL